MSFIVIGLIFDIIGAVFLSIGILMKSPFKISTEWRRLSNYNELLKNTYEKCKNFDNTIIGVSFLLLGFLLQILGTLKIEINIDLSMIILILFGFYVYFMLVLTDSYKLEASVYVLLSIIKYNFHKDELINIGQFSMNLPANSNISANELLEIISINILSKRIFINKMDTKKQADIFYDEICIRYDLYELPQEVYSKSIVRRNVISKERSLLKRALCTAFF